MVARHEVVDLGGDARRERRGVEAVDRLYRRAVRHDAAPQPVRAVPDRRDRPDPGHHDAPHASRLGERLHAAERATRDRLDELRSMNRGRDAADERPAEVSSCSILTSTMPSASLVKVHATAMPRVTPPVCRNSSRRASGSGRTTASHRTGIWPRRAPMAKRRSSRGAEPADVTVVRQPLRPALDLGGEPEDAPSGRATLMPTSLLMAAAPRRDRAGRRASVAGRQSPSAEPSVPPRPGRRRAGAGRGRARPGRRACPAPPRSARPWRRTRRAARRGIAPPRPHRRRASASAAARAERSARKIPSPVNGSIKPAASPTRSQPSPGGAAHPVADRRHATDRGQAPRPGETRRDGGDAGDRGGEPPSRRPRAAGERQRHADVELAARRRRQARRTSPGRRASRRGRRGPGCPRNGRPVRAGAAIAGRSTPSAPADR